MRPVRLALLIAALGAAQAQAGVFDDDDLPAAGAGPAGRGLHDGAHLVDADGQPLGNHAPHVGVRARHGRRAGPAGPAARAARMPDRESSRMKQSSRLL